MKPKPRHLATIICGNAGVGKTSLGLRLAQEQGAVLLDIDIVSEAMVRASLLASGQDPTDRDSASFKSLYREAIHETLFRIANHNLDHLPCFLIAPFTQERRQRDFLSHLRSKLNTRVRVLYLTCDDEVRRSRIELRGNPRDRAKLDSWSQYVEAGKDLHALPFEHEKIDTSSLW